MKKKLISVALAAITAVLTACMFVACGDDSKPAPPADTFFVGALSAQSYASIDEAAEAFLENEVAGDATEIISGVYKKQADLTDEEIAALDIADDVRVTITAAEKGAIDYAESDTPDPVSASAIISNTKSVNVCMIRIGTSFKYYAPALSNGDILTKSYFDAVFEPSQYVNCTAAIKMTTKSTASIGGYKASGTQTQSLNIQITEKYIYATLITTSSGVYQSAPQNAEIFMVCNENQNGAPYDTYVKHDGVWYQSAVPTDLSDKISVRPETDYSYFVKTNSGFKINSDKFDKYIETALDEMSDIMQDLDLSSIKANAEFFVNNGIMYKTTATVSAKMSILGATGNIKATTTAVYDNFGTTVVTVPADLEVL